MTTTQIRNNMNKFKNQFTKILSEETDKYTRYEKLNRLDEEIYQFFRKTINKSITSNSEMYYVKLLKLKNDIKFNIDKMSL